jgi:hypothetical protein
MTRRDVNHHRAIRALAAAMLPLMVLGGSAVAQSPSVAAPSAGAPIATPTHPTIDPDSPIGMLLGMRDALEADRVLLAELRKEVPTTRAEGEAFVTRVADLALAADPAALGVIVSRVREAAPAWLEWREGQYTTAQEAAEAYAQSGAAAFDASWKNLHDAALLTVVNRLDTIIELADRIEAGQ